ncbi:TonB-dependent receptor [Nonlabens sp.]|uniref:TonB-dependent receptor n=1 Tax=Nonlabens sp. TaxID=1888209 RepID=UPI0032637F92
MKKLILCSVLLLCYAFAKAQSKTTYDINITVVSEEDNEPLLGANAIITTLKKGAMSDINGKGIIKDVPAGTYELTVSYIGHESKTITAVIPDQLNYTFNLHEAEGELDEIVIQSTRSSRTFKRTPTRIELIGGEELVEKTAMNSTNIAMMLRESTGIQMQQTSQSSANQSIRIQGLDGRYTQLLKDGFPLYGGFAGGLSIMQIPPLDIAQFEIIKGSSSTLYGGGAIAGLVNMQSKRPKEEKELDLMLVGTQALGVTGNIFYSARKEKWGVTLYGSANSQKEYDPDGDNFSNLPKARTITLNPKVFYYPSDKTTLWVGLNGTYDQRKGGDLDAINDESNAYTEENISRRFSTQAVWETNLTDHSSLQFKNSVAYFNRELLIPAMDFKGSQINTFTEANYKTNTDKTDWIFGGNLYTSEFDEDAVINQRDQKDLTAGLFVNNVTDLSDNWILETGLRTDFTRDWGSFILPRASLLFKSDGRFTSRLGGGLGYKIPDIFTEDAERLNFQNVVAIDKNQLVAETSYGMNLDFDYGFSITDQLYFSINQLFYLTAIDNGLLLNSSATNPGSFEYSNASDLTLSRGAETNIKFTYKDFKWFLNYALIDTQLNYLDGNPEKPLTAKHNAGSVVMYENEKWRIGYETYYTGKQLLFDGTESRDYLLMGLLVMKNFDWGNLYMNFENITDRRQSRYSPTVTIDAGGAPTFNEIYAPTDGFILSAGVIWKPFGNKSHHGHGHHDD